LRLFFLHILFWCIVFQGNAQEKKHLVYFIPGQGADERLFKNIELAPDFEMVLIHYSLPEKGWQMRDFAKSIAKQIDTTANYSIVGVSLGGMLATEMADFLNPERVIIISSAKKRSELPFRYRFQKTIPLYKIVPPSTYRIGSKVLQPIVEPDRKKDAETFKAMLNDKNPLFLKRTTKMIMEWERTNYNKKIVHIHGDNDHTLPDRNIHFDYLVEDGSHMMVLTKGAQISKMLNQILLNSDIN